MITNPEHKHKLVNIFTTKAIDAGPKLSPEQWFRKLIKKSTLPQNWEAARIGALTGDSALDAIELIDWASHRKINNTDSRFTTLGSILTSLLPELDKLEAGYVAALIDRYSLYRDIELKQKLIMGYQIPMDTTEFEGEPEEFGPEIDWVGPSDEQIEHQGFLRKPPDFLDMGFIIGAAEKSRGICRIEYPEEKFRGTGFLIGNKQYLLTNYHVFKYKKDDNLEFNIKETILRFGCFTMIGGDESKGQTYKLTKEKPIAQSPIKELDFLLLRVEDAINDDNGINEISEWELDAPEIKSGLNILQHPGGDPMKLGYCDDGVSWIDEKGRLIQYATRAQSGSSGSPCFNENWDLVALHHAQRLKSFGSIREGILFSAIYAEIQKFL